LEGFVFAMLEDVVAAVSRTRGLAGVAIVTLDPRATCLARRYGARVLTAGARDGHTGAVAAAAHILTAEGIGGMMQLPGDIPLVSPDELSTVLAMSRRSPSFTIVPSHDDFGSNTVVVSPPMAVPLTFGDDSFYPHLRAAQRCGISPLTVRMPGISRDIDNPQDLCDFARIGSSTRTQAYLDQHDSANWVGATSAICGQGET
ncbi:MAG: 2-phospho-L-lactate guanylyltransferase, partial [bacterium]